MNIYNEDGNDTNDILTGKFWLERPKKPLLESETPVRLNLGELPQLSVPNSLASEPPANFLTKINQLEHKLSQIQGENSSLKKQNTHLQKDLAESNEQKSYETTQREQIQQKLTKKNEIIDQLEQKLINEQEKHLTAENNLAQEKQISHNLRQQLQAEKQNNQTLRENNANLTQQIANQEQNHINLQTAYQITLKEKQTAEKQANYYEQQLKSIAKALHQWQKLNCYQQLEKQRNEFQAQIIQPPPWKPNK